MAKRIFLSIFFACAVTSLHTLALPRTSSDDGICNRYRIYTTGKFNSTSSGATVSYKPCQGQLGCNASNEREYQRQECCRGWKRDPASKRLRCIKVEPSGTLRGSSESAGPAVYSGDDVGAVRRTRKASGQLTNGSASVQVKTSSSSSSSAGDSGAATEGDTPPATTYRPRDNSSVDALPPTNNSDAAHDTETTTPRISVTADSAAVIKNANGTVEDQGASGVGALGSNNEASLNRTTSDKNASTPAVPATPTDTGLLAKAEGQPVNATSPANSSTISGEGIPVPDVSTANNGTKDLSSGKQDVIPPASGAGGNVTTLVSDGGTTMHPTTPATTLVSDGGTTMQPTTLATHESNSASDVAPPASPHAQINDSTRDNSTGQTPEDPLTLTKGDDIKHGLHVDTVSVNQSEPISYGPTTTTTTRSTIITSTTTPGAAGAPPVGPTVSGTRAVDPVHSSSVPAVFHVDNKTDMNASADGAAKGTVHSDVSSSNGNTTDNSTKPASAPVTKETTTHAVSGNRTTTAVNCSTSIDAGNCRAANMAGSATKHQNTTLIPRPLEVKSHDGGTVSSGNSSASKMASEVTISLLLVVSIVFVGALLYWRSRRRRRQYINCGTREPNLHFSNPVYDLESMLEQSSLVRLQDAANREEGTSDVTDEVTSQRK